MRILLVEDSPDDTFFFRRVAKKAGIDNEVEVASDGAQAVRLLNDRTSRAVDAPNLIFLDLKMPHMNGFEVLQWLREHADCHTIPVVVLSSSDQPADIKKAKDLGARLFLTKPITQEQLQEIVKQFC